MKARLIYSTRMRLKPKKPKTHENETRNQIFSLCGLRVTRVCVFATHGHDHDPLRTKPGMVAKGSKAEVTVVARSR